MDAVERTITYLRAATGVKVSQDTAHNRKSTPQHIEVARVGGPSGLFLDRPRLTVDCYAQSGAGAYALAESVAAHIRAFPDNDQKVSGAEVNALYRNEWTADGSPCYSLTVNLVINV